jgi:transposase
MAHILKMHQQTTVQSLSAQGWSLRRISRELGLHRNTVLRYAGQPDSKCAAGATTGTDGREPAKCTTPAAEVTTGSGAPDEPKCTTPAVEVTTGSRSLCAAFKDFLGPMVEQGLSARRAYQDLVAGHGFTGSYPSVRRFVAKLRNTPEGRVWRVECAPGEEMQVDFGLGAPIRLANGKTRRSWVFRAVLGNSRKGYSEAVFRQDTETFLRVLENALRHFGGVPLLLNLDNLKAAVIRADWYDPEMNPKLMDFCRHYGITAMPCRAYTPQHKGKVERGVAYVKSNALKGRVFDSLAAQNAHLLHWEEHVADKRIHGTTRRQVAAMFMEERPHLGPLPLELFSCYQESRRRVQRDGFVEVAKSWYEAPAEYIGATVWARWDGRTVRLLNAGMEQIALHTRLEPGKFSHALGVRGFNGTVGQTMEHWKNRAAALGGAAGQWAERAFDQRGAEAMRSVKGLCQLKDRHRAADINAACAAAMAAASGLPAFVRIKDLLDAGGHAPEQGQMDFREADPVIRPLETYAEHVREHGGTDPFAGENTDPGNKQTEQNREHEQPDNHQDPRPQTAA